MMKEIVLGLGCNPSIMDGSEYEFEVAPNLHIPESYSFKEFMSPVLNQGATNMCVTYAIGAHIDWNINMDLDTAGADNHVDRKAIYSARTVAGDNGMSFKDAFKFIRNNGVNTDAGKVNIDYYAKIGGELALKQALIANGPCVGGMLCYNENAEFWNQIRHERSLGGHAISIVGYNKDGFIIRNSWGPNWANHGYSILKYYDFPKMFEIWTIID